ncbi:hypothetical protein BDZ91DRAFT_843826 [Kalaharituber pfeilii]|nr:hypothetical protein BDZ91DRAFT_843826 [Kalaharituber pfeilii]
MDITPLFNEALSAHNAPVIPIGRNPPPPVDKFLREAYLIESHISNLTRDLLAIRQSYLSIARAPLPNRVRRTNSSSSISSFDGAADRRYLTDKERDDIDMEAKAVIRDSLTAIQRLESAEKIRIDTEKMQYRKRRRKLDLGKVFQGGWKSLLVDEENEKEDEEDDHMKVIRLHREGVIWLLKTKLEKASEIQRTQQETRVMRQVERSKDMLYKATGAPVPPSRPGSSTGPSTAEIYRDGSMPHRGTESGWGGVGSVLQDEKEDIEQTLSPEQLQIFAKENQDMMKYYEDTLDQVRTAEKSLIEISEMQTQLASSLATQSVFIDQLVNDSITTVEDLEKGNKQLKEAAERSSMASSFFYGAICFSVLVITYDFLI